MRQLYNSIILIFILSFCFGQQAKLKTGWERVLIPEVGFIDIHPSLELQLVLGASALLDRYGVCGQSM